MRFFGSTKTTAALAGKGSSMNHIDTRKSTVNTQRKFGSDSHYHGCIVIDSQGRRIPALFTDAQISVAVQRAKAQPEDAPQAARKWWRWLG